MREKKYSHGDRVLYKGRPAIIEGVTTYGYPGGTYYTIRHQGWERVTCIPPNELNPIEPELEPIEDTKKKSHKKITIKVKREGDGYRIIGFDALKPDELPEEYIAREKTYAYLSREGRTLIAQGEKYNYFLERDELYSTAAFLRIKAICVAAGKRLHDINKRKREEAKVETWEW